MILMNYLFVFMLMYVYALIGGGCMYFFFLLLILHKSNVIYLLIFLLEIIFTDSHSLGALINPILIKLTQFIVLYINIYYFYSLLDTFFLILLKNMRASSNFISVVVSNVNSIKIFSICVLHIQTFIYATLFYVYFEIKLAC